MFALEKNWLIAKSVWENVFEIPSTKCDLTFSHIIRHASISKTLPYKDILVPLKQLNCDQKNWQLLNIVFNLNDSTSTTGLGCRVIA